MLVGPNERAAGVLSVLQLYCTTEGVRGMAARTRVSTPQQQPIHTVRVPICLCALCVCVCAPAGSSN